MKIPTPQSFGRLSDGREILQFHLTSGSGVEIRFITYGGIVTELLAPDRNGNVADLVLGHRTLAEYEGEHPNFGAAIGRFGNRIAGARCTLDGSELELERNEARGNFIHGGSAGFHRQVWLAQPFSDRSGVGVHLFHLSPDGTGGLPGNLTVRMTYHLSDEGAFSIDYLAVTDRPTYVNLTHHSYFHLGGHDAGAIDEHRIRINAPRYLPVDEHFIPTGELADVGDTPFDLRESVRVGDRLGLGADQLRLAGGFDHCFVFPVDRDRDAPVARVEHPASGRVLELFTSEPGTQFYTGNSLAAAPQEGKGGRPYRAHEGLCLECQHFPDSPNHRNFPSTRLDPGMVFESRTTYAFGVDG